MTTGPSTKARHQPKCPVTRKVCWPTEQIALEQLEMVRLLGMCWRKENRVYECRHCGQWHLTSQPKGRAADRANPTTEGAAKPLGDNGVKDRGRIEARLANLGLSPILENLLGGPLQETISIPLSSLSVAKATQRLLYGWLTYNPEVKASLKMRLDEATATLLLMPAVAERRGRRHIY